tara:strand:+ start:160 stop:762 length:603 start_codon:yes stop_codon:yes gene_type:complete
MALDLHALIQAYAKRNPQEKDKAQCFLHFLSQPSALHQLTGSSWLVHPHTKQVLLTHHKKLKRWLQLGGHVEPHDSDIFQTALREAKEESGLTNLSPMSTDIFHLGIHTIPHSENANDEKHPRWQLVDGEASNSHYHFDICFLHAVQADEAENVCASDESHEVAWFPLSRILTMASPDSQLHTMAKKWQIMAFEEALEPA